MNERIRKLVEQAALATNEDPNGEYPAHMMQKFAELIIRECLEILNVKEYSYQNGDLAEKIKQHFGVEE